MPVRDEFSFQQESKIHHYYVIKSISFYFKRLFKPILFFLVWLILWRLLLLFNIFGFLQLGFFSFGTKILILLVAGWIGYKVAEEGKIFNAALLGVIFGLILGIFDAATFYFYSIFTKISFPQNLSTLGYIFIPINLAIFCSILAIVGFSIKR